MDTIYRMMGGVPGKAICAVALAAVLVLTAVGPAAAYDEETGSRYCGGTTPFGWLTATSTASDALRGPGGFYYFHFTGAGTHTIQGAYIADDGGVGATVVGGGSWRAYTASGTFTYLSATCRSYG